MPTMEITTMIGCPLMCTFCPQELLRGHYGKQADKYLSFDRFKMMLDKIPLHVRIDFSGMAEPWANPEATKMLEYTLEKGYRVAIYTTLYGISDEDSVAVVDLLNKYASLVMDMCIHLPDANMNMRGYRTSDQYKRVLLRFIEVGRSNEVLSPRFSIMTMDSSGKVHADLREIVESTPSWKGHSRAGNLDQETVDKIGALAPPRNEFTLGCNRNPFYDHNVLLPNGDVLLCCMDYGMKHVLGNLVETSYYGVFSGPALGNLRAINQCNKFSEDSLCKSCERVVKYEVNTQNALWETPKPAKLEVHPSDPAQVEARADVSRDIGSKDIIRYLKRKLRLRA